MALNNCFENTGPILLLEAQNEILSSVSQVLILLFSISKGRIKEKLDLFPELLLSEVVKNLQQTLENILLQHMRVLEMINISNITKVIELSDNKLFVVIHSTEFPEHKYGTIRQLPEFLGSAEPMIHAATASLQLGSKRAATKQHIVVMLTVLVLFRGHSELSHISEV